jgi:hypothetical protein
LNGIVVNYGLFLEGWDACIVEEMVQAISQCISRQLIYAEIESLVGLIGPLILLLLFLNCFLLKTATKALAAQFY